MMSHMSSSKRGVIEPKPRHRRKMFISCQFSGLIGRNPGMAVFNTHLEKIMSQEILS